MATTLTGSRIATTYAQLLHLDDGVDATTEKYIRDGDGTATCLSVSGSAVGIGTTSPSQLLEVNGAIRIDNTDCRLELHDTSGDADIGQISYDHGSNAMNFVVAAAQAMIIDSSQQVGIGTTSPDTLLEVSGSFASNGPSSTFVTFSDGDATPSVATGNIFKHHASTQTINMFDGGVCGQIITVISTAAITYDFNASNLKCGSADIVTADGDVTMWVFDGTNWYLLSWMDVSANLADGSAGGF